MAEARSRDNWAHTSAVLALVANVNRDPKKTRAYKPSDFDPFAKNITPMRVGVEALKDVFIHKRIPRQGG